LSFVVNTPVDSTTMSTPLAPHGISSGALRIIGAFQPFECAVGLSETMVVSVKTTAASLRGKTEQKH